MQAVSTCAAPQCDDQIADVCGGRMFSPGQQTGTAAEDQRIAQIALVVDDRAVDRGQPQLVAVVADAGDDALGNAPRMEHAVRHLIDRVVLGPKAEHVGGGDGPCRDADDVAHDAADAGIGPAEGLQRRRMVVGLDLEGQVQRVVKGDDAGVVDKGRVQPVGIDDFGGGADVLVEQAVDCLLVDDLAVGILNREIDLGAEGLMHAVLRPGLCQGLQFDVGGRTAQVGIKLLDDSHLIQIEGEQALSAERQQRVGIESVECHALHRVTGGGLGVEMGRHGAEAEVLDGLVAEQLAGQRSHLRFGQLRPQVRSVSRS